MPRTTRIPAVVAACALLLALPAVADPGADPAPRSGPAHARAVTAAAGTRTVVDVSVRGRGVVPQVRLAQHAHAALTVRHPKASKRATTAPRTHAKPSRPRAARFRPRPGWVNAGHYIRSLRGNRHDVAIMRTLGARDAHRNPPHTKHVVLLDIGGQVPGGVFLSTTHRFISYRALTRAVQAYVSGYHQRQHSDAPVVIAIGTNNDLLVNAATGRQWARNVVNPVREYAKHYPQITIAGADDIEPGFSAGPAATRAWLSGYLANTKAPFVFNGSADGCSWRSSNSHCLRGWTSRDLIQLAAYAAPKRTVVLPQIYNAEMAGQWAQLAAAARRAHKPMNIVGPLTENHACGADPSCPTMPSSRAWTRLWASLNRTHAVNGPLPIQVDLDVS